MVDLGRGRHLHRITQCTLPVPPWDPFIRDPAPPSFLSNPASQPVGAGGLREPGLEDGGAWDPRPSQPLWCVCVLSLDLSFSVCDNGVNKRGKNRR